MTKITTNIAKKIKNQAILSETQIEKHVCAYAEEKGMLVAKVNVPGQRGWPDRLFECSYGHHFYIEFKKPKNGVVSTHQTNIAKKLREKGVMVYYCHTMEEGRRAVDTEVAKLVTVVDIQKSRNSEFK